MIIMIMIKNHISYDNYDHNDDIMEKKSILDFDLPPSPLGRRGEGIKIASLE